MWGMDVPNKWHKHKRDTLIKYSNKFRIVAKVLIWNMEGFSGLSNPIDRQIKIWSGILRLVKIC